LNFLEKKNESEAIRESGQSSGYLARRLNSPNTCRAWPDDDAAKDLAKGSATALVPRLQDVVVAVPVSPALSAVLFRR
jgi:hypothetical protein